MSEIRFNSILDGVSLAVHAAFPVPAQVHGGEVEQGLKPGDFNIIMPAASHVREVGPCCRRTPTLDVIYYPKRGSTECYAVADRLTEVLGSITTPEGDVVHATSCEWNITDGVLHVLVTYSHFVRVPQEHTMMGALKIEQEG